MAEVNPLRAAVPIPTPGLVSPGLKKAYRDIVEELSRGYEDPTRDVALEGEEGIVTGLTRLAKLYGVDYPVDFLVRGGEALESPDTLTSEELLGLAGEAVMFGSPGAGTGPAGMGGRVPMKEFFSPLQKGSGTQDGRLVEGSYSQGSADFQG